MSDPMTVTPDQLRQALRESQEVWAQRLKAEKPEHVTALGCATCPLCRLLSASKDGNGPDCVQCPVFERTKHFSCADTPYEEVGSALHRWQEASLDLRKAEIRAAAAPASFGRGDWSVIAAQNLEAAAKGEWRKACGAEVDFLLSLEVL